MIYLPEGESDTWFVFKNSLFYISKIICIQLITLFKADIFS